MTFWGTRGSIASPGPDTLHYGGNTSCVSVRAGAQIFVFDCGTGVRRLGNDLLKSGLNGQDINLFISHAHWDHIQGFPFFAPLFVPGAACNVFAPQEHRQRLKDTMAGQMQYRYFPVELDHLSAAIRYNELREGSFNVGDSLVACQYLNHTTVTMAYRLQHAGRTLAYVTDTEPFAQKPRGWADPSRRTFFHSQDEQLAAFVAGADVLIMDSQYRPEEYPAKVTWGHGTFDYCLDIAISAGVKNLVLYHHDPMRDDLAVEGMLQACWRRVASEGSSLVVAAAAEGMTVALDEAAAAAHQERPAPLPRFLHEIDIAAAGIDDEARGLLGKALSEEHHRLSEFGDLRELAAGDAPGFDPHLALVQPGRSKALPAELAAVRQRYGAIPVLMLLPDGDEAAMDQAFRAGVSDVLVRPMTFSQLRARVDAWLFRGGIALDRRARPR